jgi:pilus assembly protein Flp/PilA
MTKLLAGLKKAVFSLAQGEEGAQVVEYALIIAIISIALVIALSTLTSSGGNFAAFITRITTCLTGGVCA